MQKILITGSEGLIGRALSPLLLARGYIPLHFDHCLPPTSDGHGDVTRVETLRRALPGCIGVIHLAAVSRVVWGEREPAKCIETNYHGTQNVLRLALEQTPPPWVIFSSSREVYGQPDSLPAREDIPLCPLNVYARAKREAEQAVFAARRRGLQTAVVRLSNVYGCARDHIDRVVPAFARAAARGQAMRVDGRGHTFDFTHVNDTVRGLMAVVERLQAGEWELPPIHFLTGKPTTLGELAELAKRLGRGNSPIHEAPGRDFDVARFYGDPTRARELLGWRAEIGIEAGLRHLIADLSAQSDPQFILERIGAP